MSDSINEDFGGTHKSLKRERNMDAFQRASEMKVQKVISMSATTALPLNAFDVKSTSIFFS